jgi:hypothetical protein
MSPASKWIVMVLEDELYYALAVIFACVVSFGIGMLAALIVY